MTEEIQQDGAVIAQGETAEAAPAPEEPKKNTRSLDDVPPELAQYIRELREEAASRRKALSELQRQAEQERIKTIEQAKAALAAQQEQADELAQRLEAFNETFKQSNAARIAALPERFRAIVPEFDDPAKVAQWLDKNERLLRQPIPDTGAGQQGPPSGNSLSEEEIKFAKLLGVDPTEAAKYKE